jgi:hypothetical protein
MDGIVRQSDEAERYLPEQIPPATTRASQSTLVQAAETVARRCHESVRPDQAREYTNAATVRERNEGRNKVNTYPSGSGSYPARSRCDNAAVRFEPIRTRDPARQYDYLSTSVGIEVNDLHDENALVTEPGEVVVIDPVPLMEEASKLARLRAWANPAGSGFAGSFTHQQII